MDKIIFLLMSGMFAMNVMAQQPTFFATPKPMATTPGTATPHQVMSPAEFNNQVSTLSTKNEAAFKQHLSQQISQIPPAVVPKVTLPKTVPDEQNAKLPFAPNTEERVLPPTVPQTEEVITPQTLPPTASIPPPVIPKAPPESYSTTPPPSTHENSGFTGFGTGTTTAPSQKSQGSSGGWNIKY
jgi:hypothetical protein